MTCALAGWFKLRVLPEPFLGEVAFLAYARSVPVKVVGQTIDGAGKVKRFLGLCHDICVIELNYLK